MGTRKPRGQPRRIPTGVSTRTLSFRVTEEEADWILGAAVAAGERRSDWLRRTVLREAGGPANLGQGALKELRLVHATMHDGVRKLAQLNRLILTGEMVPEQWREVAKGLMAKFVDMASAVADVVAEAESRAPRRQRWKSALERVRNSAA